MASWIKFLVLCLLIIASNGQIATVQPSKSNTSTSGDTIAAMDAIINELYGTSLKICLTKSLDNSSNTLQSMQKVAKLLRSDTTNLQIPLEVLKTCLFTASYDKEVAPYLISAHDILDTPNYSYPFNYTITLNELLGISMGGSITFTSNFIFMWQDYRLRWQKTTVMEPWTFPHVLSVPTYKVWMPQLSVRNCQKRWCPISPDNSTKIRLESNGSIELEFSDMLEASCQLDLRNFPFDEQTCNVTISFENLDDGDVIVKLNQMEIGYSEYINECDELQVIYFSHEISSTDGYSFTSDTAEEGKWNRRMQQGLKTSVTVTIKAIRVTTFYLTNLIIPLLVVIAITFATVIYPTGSSEKVNTLLTMILALVFFQSVLASVMPKTRDDPRLGKYVMWSTLFAGLDLFMTYASIFAVNVGEKGRPLPMWAWCFLDSYRHLCVRCCGLRKAKSSSQVDVSQRNSNVNAPEKRREEKSGSVAGGHVDKIATANIRMIDDDMENAEAEFVDKKEPKKDEQAEKNEQEWRRFAEALNIVFNMIYIGLNIIIFAFYMVPLFTAFIINSSKTSYFKD